MFGLVQLLHCWLGTRLRKGRRKFWEMISLCWCALDVGRGIIVTLTPWSVCCTDLRALLSVACIDGSRRNVILPLTNILKRIDLFHPPGVYCFDVFFLYTGGKPLMHVGCCLSGTPQWILGSDLERSSSFLTWIYKTRTTISAWPARDNQEGTPMVK